ncbi:MAG: hydroxypyruvate isomerase [Streptosporangiaceae bacterium]|nr:hydroxypyruvate isomerase [Streptosporangiaceae bacterium]
MRYDINLSMLFTELLFTELLFTELPLLERPAAARAAGFDAVEMWWPFAVPVPGDRKIDTLLRAFTDAGVRLAGLNFDASDMAAGERGLLSRPAGSARFRANVDVAVGIAEATGCKVLNALYGSPNSGPSPNWSRFPTDQLPTEQLPTEQLPTDQLPTDQLPTDQRRIQHSEV